VKFTHFLDEVDFDILKVSTIYRTQVVLPEQWEESICVGCTKEYLLLEKIVNIAGEPFLAKNELASNSITMSWALINLRLK